MKKIQDSQTTVAAFSNVLQKKCY